MLKVKMFNSASSDALEDKINSFSAKHKVVNIQYSNTLDMIMGLQQFNATCRTLHYAMVTYEEGDDK
ncbi:hypothetical protein [uncultured Clostridium sp.]|uniref:hypothetical protein n=1 Tax=uncultured Clostridium sp. TaxID=59620 RepID=UPI0026F0C42A|nr:hypothetical protein [uncultured Clostridium sp.]